MTWGQYLFSFRGRMNRAPYWGFVALAFVFFAAIFAFLFAFVGFIRPGASPPHMNPALAIVLGLSSVALYLGFLVASLAVATKRLHDRAKSGWWLVVFAVLPAVLNLGAFGTRLSGDGTSGVFSVLAFAFSLWGFVEMGCLRGTDGPNRFGPDPLSYAPDVAASTFN